jgi:D-glycero-D-manno-heptose 1,7-bisphosphate phosphatase
MKLVFLDRDGVINKFPGRGAYVTKVKDLHFIPGSLQAIRALTETGHKIFVISNQAGVGKGVYSFDKLRRIDAKMIRAVEKAGGHIRKSFYCTHRSDAGCDCRKPNVGLLKKALKSLNKTIVHAQQAFFVGDTERDIKTGHKVGCKTIFVLSGHGRRHHVSQWTVKPDHIVKDLKSASEIIQHANSPHPRNSRRRS